MTMLPWFNQYPYTDFHELNIDWLCSAYKQYHEQLVQFDQRLDNLETDVNERISAMEADIAAQDERINTFITTINAEFASFRSEINQQFADLETSFNERFTTLQTNLEAEISALEASINQQFADLSSDLNDRITAFENEVEQSLADLAEDLKATTEFAYDSMANSKVMGTFNYFPIKDSAPWSSDNMTFQSTAGVVLCNGYVNEDQHITIAGGSDSFPAAFKDMPEDMQFIVQFATVTQAAAGFPKLIMIMYENGQESSRQVFNRGGYFTMTELAHRSLSGIEFQWLLETGVQYDVKFKPFIYGTSEGGIFAYSMYNLSDRINDESEKIYRIEANGKYAESSNLILLGDVDTEDEAVRVEVDGVINISGTIAEDKSINIGYITAPIVDTYGTILIDPDGSDTTYDSVAIDLKIHDEELDEYTTVATITPDDYTVIPAYSEPYEEYAVFLRITAGEYDLSCLPYVSYNKSNKQLEDEALALEDRVQDIEDELMGETTYGPADLITFTDPVGDVPLKEVVVDIIPDQDLHGYDYPWPAGGNKNLIEVTNGSYAAGADLFNGSVDLPAGTYTLSSSNTTSQVAVVGVGSGVMPYTFTLSAAVTSLQITAVQAGTFNNVQLEAGSTATSFVPYSNVCPISGWNSCDVTRTGINIWDEDYTVFSNMVMSNNYIPCKPNTTYYRVSPNNIIVLYYDKDKNSLGNSTWGRGIFTTPANCSFIRFQVDPAYGTTYNNDISINYPATETSYHAYEGDTYIMALGDTYYGVKFNVTTGVLKVHSVAVNMGSLNWVSTGDGRFKATISDMKIAPIRTLHLMCSVYQTNLGNDAFLDKSIYNGSNESSVIAYDTTYSSDTANDFKAAMQSLNALLVYELATPTEIQLTPLEIKTVISAGINNMYTNVGQITVTTQSFVQNLIQKYTERYIITYDSVAGTADRTYNEILEAYAEGRRLCFTDTANSLITELNQYDDVNGVFHWEYNEFTNTGITFYEILIDISGVTVNSKSVTI